MPPSLHCAEWIKLPCHLQMCKLLLLRCICGLAQDSDGANLDVAMAQHLLVAADRFQLPRLRGICERRLCETVSFQKLL